MDIGRKLKDLRVRKGLTQEELADRVDKGVYFPVGTEFNIAVDCNSDGYSSMSGNKYRRVFQ